jgi:ATP-dependent exoDNAse (exonuclease V) beta subunit
LVASGEISPAQFEAMDLGAIAHFWQSPVGTMIRAQEAAVVHRELPFTARFSLAELGGPEGIPGEGGHAMREPGGEWVIVQGVVDLAVIRPDEIWVLDFKTDREPAGKIEAYTPQLRLYALALERIYARRVTRLWLHFFAAHETVSLPWPSA